MWHFYLVDRPDGGRACAWKHTEKHHGRYTVLFLTLSDALSDAREHGMDDSQIPTIFHREPDE
jgi:hypothetical protein